MDGLISAVRVLSAGVSPRLISTATSLQCFSPGRRGRPYG